MDYITLQENCSELVNIQRCVWCQKPHINHPIAFADESVREWDYITLCPETNKEIHVRKNYSFMRKED